MDGAYARNKPDFSRKRKPESGKYSSRQSDASEKNKRRNTDNDSISIETLYRTLCPVSKIGSVLGKGGNIVSAIRDETHAKIRVADRIPGEEERVVIIFNHPGSESSTQYLNLETDINGEKEERQLKLHCPAQSALLKVFDRMVEDEHLDKGDGHRNDENDVTVRLLVPHNQVGCLIGKAGDVIQKLRSGTGANIRISGAESLPAGAMPTDELVQISGKYGVVRKALYEISTRLHEHPRKETPPLDEIIAASTQHAYPPGGAIDQMFPRRASMWAHEDSGPQIAPPVPFYGGYRNEPQRRADDRDMTEEFSIRVVCPTGKIGGVIGKAGANVKHVEQQTGASIHVEDKTPDSTIRIILISAKEAFWDPISPTVDAVLQLQEKVSEISDKGDITTRLLVPSSKAGCLLGQGGQVINDMRKHTRADIRVCAKGDKPSYASSNEELVQISGNQRSARDALSEIVSRLRERTLRDGATAQYPPTGLSRRFSHDNASAELSTTRYGYSSTKGFGSSYEENYQAPPPVSGYSSIRSPLESRYPSTQGPSAFGSGLDSISDFREDYGSRSRLYDPLSRSGEYDADGASWSHRGRYDDPREEPWQSYLSRPYRSLGRD